MHAAATLPDQEKQQEWGDTAEAYRELVMQMIELPKPIIASVNGPAVARRGRPRAGQRHRRRLRRPPNSDCPNRAAAWSPASSPRCWRSASAAARPPGCLLTSALYPADEAHRLGIYHELIDDTRLWARCVQLGEECAAGAPEAVQLTKRLLYETIGEQLSTQLNVGAAISATSRTTEAAQEGLTAFLEKRQPEWK